MPCHRSGLIEIAIEVFKLRIGQVFHGGRAFTGIDASDGHASGRQVGLGLADGIMTIVENAGRQGGAGIGLGQDGSQVLGVTRSAGGHHGDLQGVDHRAGHLQVVAVPGPIGIHTGQHDLAGAKALDLSRPRDGLQPGWDPPAVDVDLPDVVAVAIDPLGVDVDDDTLAAEPPGGLADQVGIAHRRRIDRHLVGPRIQERPNIVEFADTAAHRQRHEADFGRAPDDVQKDRPIFVAGRDVQEDQLVGTLFVITLGHRDRVARVPEIEEVGPLDHAAMVDVEARDDPLGQHAQSQPSPTAASEPADIAFGQVHPDRSHRRTLCIL